MDMIEKTHNGNLFKTFFFISFNYFMTFVGIMRRRARRGRMLLLGLLFIIYSAITVYSAPPSNVTNESSGNKPVPTELPRDDIINDATTKSNAALPATTKSSGTSPGTTEYDDGSASTSTTEATTTTINPANIDTRGSYRPKRYNCTPPAIDQFPPPLLPRSFREHGGLILHILIAIFTFLGLAIVCDDYFVSSLDRICEGQLNKKKTVKAKEKLKLILYSIFRVAFITGCCWCYVYGCWKFCT